MLRSQRQHQFWEVYALREFRCPSAREIVMMLMRCLCLLAFFPPDFFMISNTQTYETQNIETFEKRKQPAWYWKWPKIQDCAFQLST